MPAPGSPCGSTRIRHKLDGLPLILIPRQTGSPIVALVADDGHKGLAAFKTGHFDLVCLDIFMPTMDGLETMKLVRELQPAIPIIGISGRPLMPDSNSEPDFLAVAAKRAAARRLPKPFKPAALLAAVADCLAAATNPSAPDSDVAA